MAIRSLLRQIQARGELAIVVDPECEYVSEFYRPARGDLILNPVDERCPYWSPWLELSERYYQADAATLADSLIPEPPRGYESGSDHFFRQSSRTLLESLLQVAAPRQPQNIPKLLELGRDQLKQALSRTPAYSLIDPGAHEQGARKWSRPWPTRPGHSCTCRPQTGDPRGARSNGSSIRKDGFS
jgi:Type IV secretion-system coupling protein DNA-binding domain